MSTILERYRMFLEWHEWILWAYECGRADRQRQWLDEHCEPGCWLEPKRED